MALDGEPKVLSWIEGSEGGQPGKHTHLISTLRELPASSIRNLLRWAKEFVTEGGEEIVKGLLAGK